ncbi:MAG TPA: hypothetical protein P5119_12705 [Candidatus Aminicenantes bacterium]|nr:hypothetical protein [Candidatus Aminicenantes bacterium]HRY66186.1 hypothetical protein [Candidatus Aminicenantes bacterium]HRZ73100.1 hypothetical protein [Candidatus Aminicenantes bacterium]
MSDCAASPRRAPSRVAAALALWACGLAIPGLAQPAHGYKDGIYSVSLDVIRSEIAAAKRLPSSSESQSAWLSDFFGLQRIQDVQAGRVLQDFVPGLAAVVAEAPVLKLRFAAGYTAAFYLRCPISIDGQAGSDFHPSFVELTDLSPAFRDRYAALADFVGLLERSGLAAAYLVPNPYARFEKIAAADLAAESRPKSAGWPQYKPGEREKKRADAQAGFKAASRGILMFGDTHGAEEDFGAVWSFLNEAAGPPAIDWIGLEMLTKDKQPLVEAYLSSPDGSAAFAAAEKEMKAYFDGGWDKRFSGPGPGGDGHYFAIVKWARAHKVRLYALDSEGEYTLFRYGEFPLGATTRNIVWAEVVPLGGKGVVYGGSAHFVPLPATPYTFQDYVRRRDPTIALFY